MESGNMFANLLWTSLVACLPGLVVTRESSVVPSHFEADSIPNQNIRPVGHWVRLESG